MPVKTLKEFLDKEGVKYVPLTHTRSLTAQDVAESSHISGKELAKTVMVRIDGRMAMAVVPEQDFKGLFPECELGAMPPFGILYGLSTYASDLLARQPQIAFSAGTHTEVIRLSYADFVRLAQPKIAAITADPH